MAKPLHRPAGFTLIELLAVMLIIAILIGLALAAISGVMRIAGRDRAKSEVKTMESALESYKSDNGGYPIPPANFTLLSFGTTNDYITASPLQSGGQYQGSSAFLYEQLSGNTAAGYVFGASITPVGRVYYPFKSPQLGNNKPGAGGPIYLKDPFGASYGYFPTTVIEGTTPTTNYSFNGAGQYDIWSTAADKSNPPTNMPSWINNWAN